MTVIRDQDFVIILVAVNVRVRVFRLVGRRSVLWGDQNLRRTVWPRHSGLLLAGFDPLHLKNCSGQVKRPPKPCVQPADCSQLLWQDRAESYCSTFVFGVSSILTLKMCCISLRVGANASAIDSNLPSKLDLERILS